MSEEIRSTYPNLNIMTKLFSYRFQKANCADQSITAVHTSLSKKWLTLQRSALTPTQISAGNLLGCYDSMLCIKAAPWLCTLPAGTWSPNYEVYIQKSFWKLRRSINKYTTSFAPWVTDPLKPFSVPWFVLASSYRRLLQTPLLLFSPKIISNFLLLLINFKIQSKQTLNNKQ